MAVGLPLKTTYANGDVYSASDVNDTNGTINTTAAPYAAGKNKFINADFRFNQRSFTSTTTDLVYGFDRWQMSVSGGTCTYSAQTFTAGTAPVAGYESINFARLVTATQTLSSHYAYLGQRIEDARTFAGQTATISFWAKASTGTPSVGVTFYRSFGTGGSPSANEYAVSAGQKTAITSSWARYSLTFAINSVSGKTFGTTANTSWITPFIWTSAGTDFNTQSGSLGLQNVTIDFWGIQVEQGSTATAFQTATGTIQGELAACQRYYYPHASVNGDQIGIATYNQTTESLSHVKFPVTMRTSPTLSATSGASFYSVWVSNVNDLINSLTIFGSSINTCGLFNATESSGVAGTAGRLQNTSGFVAFVAEL
jgi:hypothetical protein